MNSITMKMQADKLIRMALQEDITSEDVSTNAVMRSAVKGTVDLIAKEDGIIAGLDVYARVFQILDEKTEISFNFKDGEAVKKGDLLGTVTGDIRVLLSGERVALNYLQRMSGIATYTKQVSKLLEGSKVTLLDTRKTTPNCRVFEKYAVRIGGRSLYGRGGLRPLWQEDTKARPWHSKSRQAHFLDQKNNRRNHGSF